MVLGSPLFGSLGTFVSSKTPAAHRTAARAVVVWRLVQTNWVPIRIIGQWVRSAPPPCSLR